MDSDSQYNAGDETKEFAKMVLTETQQMQGSKDQLVMSKTQSNLNSMTTTTGPHNARKGSRTPIDDCSADAPPHSTRVNSRQNKGKPIVAFGRTINTPAPRQSQGSQN